MSVYVLNMEELLIVVREAWEIVSRLLECERVARGDLKDVPTTLGLSVMYSRSCCSQERASSSGTIFLMTTQPRRRKRFVVSESIDSSEIYRMSVDKI